MTYFEDGVFSLKNHFTSILASSSPKIMRLSIISMFRDNKIERNTRTTLFAQILFDEKERNCMENLGLPVAQKLYSTLLFGPSAHLFAGWILARLGQPTGPLYVCVCPCIMGLFRFSTKSANFSPVLLFEGSCGHKQFLSFATSLFMPLFLFSSPRDHHLLTSTRSLPVNLWNFKRNQGICMFLKNH